ncbi:MAG TPA: AAA family ATPase [Synergistaceae bacterium]|nr:AAA family ATPase [Synergistaceae bacterium]HPJ25081.1 AAA family ATPase [Synergistaceae bacterium]HPQ37265.1 AAA family ATPase [Synergistaceae bacterium]
MENKNNRVLRELYIRHVGGIQEARLIFRGNFTVLSGESGAGKSSAVRALELLCGKRGSSDMILKGEEDLEVEALLENPPAHFWERESFRDFAPFFSDEECLILARRIKKNGRSRGMFHSRTIPLGTLSEIAGSFLSIQSQHAQLDLLRRDRQMHFLDLYGGASLLKFRSSLEDSIRESIAFEKTLRNLSEKREAFSKHLQKYEDLVAKAEEVGFASESEAEWNRELDLLAQEEALARHIHALYEGFSGEEDFSSSNLLSLLEKGAEEMPSQVEEIMGKERSERYRFLLDSSLESLQALQTLLGGLLLELDEENLSRRMEILDAKLTFLRKLKDFLGNLSGSELFEAFREMREKLRWYYESRREIQLLLEKRKEVHGKTKQMARELRRERQEAAKDLRQVVEKVLEELGMGDTLFSVLFEQRGTIRKTGAEDVIFAIARGERSFSPLEEIASGGELSRILLALHVACPEGMLPPVLIFDEVEAGLGGESALLAGRLLQKISRSFQVILITHEASIAAMGDQHILVRREGDSTIFQDLSPEGRVSELARMLSGDANNPKALEHARALLCEDATNLSSLSPEAFSLSSKA